MAFPKLLGLKLVTVGEMGVKGVRGGEEGVDDSEETEFENAAEEEVVDDAVEEMDSERACEVLLFTGVLYIGGDGDMAEVCEWLLVIRLDTGIREIPSSFRLPRALRRLGLAPSKLAPDHIDGMVGAV